MSTSVTGVTEGEELTLGVDEGLTPGVDEGLPLGIDETPLSLGEDEELALGDNEGLPLGEAEAEGSTHESGLSGVALELKFEASIDLGIVI